MILLEIQQIQHEHIQSLRYALGTLDNVQLCLLITRSSIACNRPVKQIPQRTSLVSHNASFVTEMCTCAHFCYKMMHLGLQIRYIVGFVRCAYHIRAIMNYERVMPRVHCNN